MNISNAQREMRTAYFIGGPGVLISGFVWLACAYVDARYGLTAGFLALLIGGIFIFPISLVVCRLALKRPSESRGNPLGITALESTIAMAGGILAAWLMVDASPEKVLPLAALAVGTRYFLFRTIYGDSTYWLLAGLLTALALTALLTPVAIRGGVAFAVALIELLFGAILTARSHRTA